MMLACPLWVKSRHMQCNSQCPLYPQERPRKRTSANGHVCFPPESGHVQRTHPCLLWAKSGHRSSYSITSDLFTLPCLADPPLILFLPRGVAMLEEEVGDHCFSA